MLRHVCTAGTDDGASACGVESFAIVPVNVKMSPPGYGCVRSALELDKACRGAIGEDLVTETRGQGSRIG